MRRFVAPLIAALCLPTAAMAAAPVSNDGLARIEMQVETGFLSAEERQVVNLLIQAADEMTAIYKRQAAGQGPGHGFYPDGLTKAELDAYIAAHPAQKAALMDGYTVVKRDGGKLVTVPYNVEYKAELERAAALLEKAASVTSNPSLKKFLTLRAKSFRTNDYFESEMAWMDLSGTPIEVAIGPYETYTDELYGQKTAFEAFVTLKDPAESSALDKYKGYLRAMEENLPVDNRYKNFARGGESPIAVAEQVRGGGDNTVGPQTIAFNLPNDERVREAKGAKKVVLSNVLGAKYDRILKPMGERVLVPDQAALVSKKYMTLETLFHELSHSLGPGSITVDGRATTVSAELKEIAGTAEEAKADVMGAYNILFMMDKGELPKAERSQLFASYAAGIFRAVRFGAGEAHGRGAALQYGYLKSKGALVWDPAAKRFRVDDDAMQAGLTSLLAELIKLQGDGDYAGMNAFFDKYAKLDPQAETVIATLKDIPVDIAPVYPDKI
ncbi:DNA mismatch repair protein MutT [Phenylobacterium sp. Root77]|uniref:dipeptidyl-peptidase 3 family protein n=1 Tax=unclassified Phenylobacterium TaxID=2640670 RepID=UPI0006FC9DAB|nr:MULTISPECIES: DNA mismatch repair protein MutT [unclassified Phenylobacterium]KQW71922.1 DNA mismatch repair protein MutT [Phenylobacterium sp. Root1277]KQW94843.1 DNA mismatch repair protein MutT [Phenylobacterium sp. Root1290]KRC44537.1 DNA mismatch repair protein MutT [Phenylobacterium sp. Root77]